MVRGKDVDGALGAFVFTHDVITENPPHAHHDFMKIMYVLEGHYDFRGKPTLVYDRNRRAGTVRLLASGE
jgi:hypothetical protein